MEHVSWAREEFGSASLGDVRRRKRLVQIAADVQKKPCGTVLGALKQAAKLEGAYRWLNNLNFSTDEVESARGRACLKRIEECESDVIIAVDQTSLHLPDHTGERDFGSVGNRTTESHGVHLLTAMAMDGVGTPLGIVHQLYWRRSEVPGPARVRPNKKERDHRAAEEKESKYWTKILQKVDELLGSCGAHVRPWLQCDRGADFWGAFAVATAPDARFVMTARVYTNRPVISMNGKHDYLLPWLSKLPRKGRYTVAVPQRGDRLARTARLTLRFGKAQVAIGPTRRERRSVALHFVYAVEESAPKGAAPLCWRLATTFPVKTEADALRVIRNYELRWRIEVFHFTLKQGSSDIERSQLETFDAFRRWAIIHSSVAARAERLRQLMRSDPSAPATVEFTREEIDVAIAMRHEAMVKKKPPYRPGDTPTVGEIILWIADLGGYMGPRTVPKPGTVPISRGLDRLGQLIEGVRLAKALGITGGSRND